MFAKVILSFVFVGGSALSMTGRFSTMAIVGGEPVPDCEGTDKEPNKDCQAVGTQTCSLLYTGVKDDGANRKDWIMKDNGFPQGTGSNGKCVEIDESPSTGPGSCVEVDQEQQSPPL